MLILAVALFSATPATSGRVAVAQTVQAPPADVREAARAAGYGEYADRIAEAERPAVFARPGAPGRMPAALGTSRLFGDPRSARRREVAAAQGQAADVHGPDPRARRSRRPRVRCVRQR